MGYNTTVLLYNDHSNSWPEEIWTAANQWARHEMREKRRYYGDGRFGYGQVVACEHADHSQVCVVGQNWGRYLTSVTPVERPEDLRVLAEVLRGHGYSVKAPGEKRAQPPCRWGYAARSSERAD